MPARNARFHLRTTPTLLAKLKRAARQRRLSVNAVLEACITTLDTDTTPDAHLLEQRLHQLQWDVRSLRRDQKVTVELVAFFIQTFLASVPERTAAESKAGWQRGQQRYERFLTLFKTQLADGVWLLPSLTRGGAQEEAYDHWQQRRRVDRLLAREAARASRDHDAPDDA